MTPPALVGSRAGYSRRRRPLQRECSAPAGWVAFLSELFTARWRGTCWLGVAIQGELEQPRVPLIGVPCVARAVSADTLPARHHGVVHVTRLRDDLRAALQEGDGTPRAVAGGLNFLQKDATARRVQLILPLLRRVRLLASTPPLRETGCTSSAAGSGRPIT